MLRPFSYEGGGYQNPAPLQEPEYEDQQEQKQDNMSGLTDMLGKLTEGGGAGAGEIGPAMTGGTQFASAGSAGTGGGMAGGPSMAGGSMGAEAGGGWMSSMFGGGAGGSGGGMSAAMSNPWTALAAVIVGNEIYANKKGYRDKDPLKYAGDLATGEVLNQDLEQRWLPKLGIKDGSTASDMISTVSNPVSTLFHPKRTVKRLKGLWDKIF